MAQVRTTAPERLPAWVQRRLGLVAGASLTVFTVLLIAAWHVRGPTELDNVIGGMTRLQLWSTQIESLTRLVPLSVFMATAALFLRAWARRDWFGVSLCASGPALAALGAEIAKPLVDRQISTPPALSYPSGHTTLIAALAALVVLLTYRSNGGRAATLVAMVAGVATLIMGIAVVRLKWHYPTDVVGGIALGVGVVLGTAGVLSVLWDRAAAIDGSEVER